MVVAVVVAGSAVEVAVAFAALAAATRLSRSPRFAHSSQRIHFEKLKLLKPPPLLLLLANECIACRLANFANYSILLSKANYKTNNLSKTFNTHNYVKHLLIKKSFRDRKETKMKNIIERGASWTLEETKLLLLLWGQDLVSRQSTNTKRTKETYDRISDKFAQNGYERTADQVRTRIFNMIAEYRRILKDLKPERVRKCVFFDPLHKIYHAKNLEDIKQALDQYQPTQDSDQYNTLSPSTSSDLSDCDSEAELSSQQNQANNATTNNTINNTNNNNSNSNNASNNNANANINISNSNVIPTNASSSNLKEPFVQADANSSNTTGPPTHKRHRAESTEGPAPPGSNTFSSSKSAIINQTNTNNTSNINSINPILAQQANQNSRQHSLLLSNQTPTTSMNSQHSTPLNTHKKATTSATIGGNHTSFINLNNTKLPIFRSNQIIGHSNNTAPNDSANGSATRLPTAITSHSLYPAPVSTFDVTSSALLIDRMFAHLSRESENMREWIALEKERLSLERQRRQQEIEREARREKNLVDTLAKYQEQWLTFVSHLDPNLVAASSVPRPQLNLNSSNVSETNNAGTAANFTPTNSQPDGNKNSPIVVENPTSDSTNPVPEEDVIKQERNSDSAHVNT